MYNSVIENLQLVEDCEVRESRLTEWESVFIDDLRVWLEQDRSLTEKQQNRLNAIWEKATARG